MKNNVNSFKQWRGQGGWQRCPSGISCELCFGDCNGCCWCPSRSHLQGLSSCPSAAWLLTVNGSWLSLSLENYPQQNGSPHLRGYGPYLPTGYGQWLTDTGVWKAGFFAFRWYYLLVQCVLQNSPWDRIEARVPSETPWLRRSSSCPSLLPHSFLPQEITCPKSHLRLGFQGTQFKSYFWAVTSSTHSFTITYYYFLSTTNFSVAFHFGNQGRWH